MHYPGISTNGKRYATFAREEPAEIPSPTAK